MLRFLLQITSLKQGDVLSLQFRAPEVKFQTLFLTSEIPLWTPWTVTINFVPSVAVILVKEIRET